MTNKQIAGFSRKLFKHSKSLLTEVNSFPGLTLGKKIHWIFWVNYRWSVLIKKHWNTVHFKTDFLKKN